MTPLELIHLLVNLPDAELNREIEVLRLGAQGRPMRLLGVSVWGHGREAHRLVALVDWAYKLPERAKRAQP
jgi:hypothetical protein